MASRDRKSTRLNSSHTEIYTLSLHDALPILVETNVHYPTESSLIGDGLRKVVTLAATLAAEYGQPRSEEHTSELQSHRDLHSFPTRRSSDLGGDERSLSHGVEPDWRWSAQGGDARGNLGCGIWPAEIGRASCRERV